MDETSALPWFRIWFLKQYRTLRRIRSMSAQVVFLTLFLGLIAGRQPVALQVGQAVKTLRLFVDRQAATLTAPPWRATVDLGANIQPRELLAIGYGSEGDEVGRAAQVVNLPRPLAEFTIALQAEVEQYGNDRTSLGTCPRCEAIARHDQRRWDRARS